jgi:hypothetical protein
MKALGEDVVGRGVVGQWVPSSVACLSVERQEVRDSIALALDVLGAEALLGLNDQLGECSSDQLDWLVVGRVRAKAGGAEEPTDRRGVVAQCHDALADEVEFLAFEDDQPGVDNHG